MTFTAVVYRKGSPPGARLRRGYSPPAPSDKQQEVDVKQEEVDNYCARVPVDRLVLACHGIGQKLAVSNIAHDAACMRLILRQLSQVKAIAMQGNARMLSSQQASIVKLSVHNRICLSLGPVKSWL